MPLETKTIDEVLNYCKRDLPQEHDWYIHEFDFIKNQALQESLAPPRPHCRKRPHWLWRL